MSAITRVGLFGPMAAYPPFLPKATTTIPTVEAFDWMLEMYQSGGWEELTPDVLAFLTCEYGIRGADPRERVAPTGELAYVLDNSEDNSAATIGYYSPVHPSKRAGFGFNTPIRLWLSAAGDSSYKFRGRLSDINPMPGVYHTRDVACKALDWMDEAAQIDLPDIETQLGKREDELVTTILDAMEATDQPAARSIETGLDTFQFALDGGAADSQRPKVREALIQIARSGFSYGYPKGDPVQGGTFTWENRHHRALNPDVAFTLTEDLIQSRGLVVPGSRDEIYSTVQVFVRPARVDTAATTVLFSLQTAETLIRPGEINDTLFGPYRDPNNNDQIGGLAQVAPVATTDYTMNTASDGSGTDLTADFTVTASFSGLGVRFTIENTGGVPGYVTKLQLRGKGIYRYDAMIEVAVAGSYGTRVLALEMPYQNSTNVAADVAHYLASILASPFAHIKSVRFLASERADLLQAAILREPGDRVAVSETVTGIDSEFTINGVRLEIQPGGILYCTWWLEPATQQHFWIIGVVGASEIGVSTVLGF